MQVIINIGGRWKGDRKAHKLLELHAERINVTMNRLAKAFKFRLPKDIILRPLYFKGDFAAAYGRAIYNPFAGYIIAMNIPYCSDMHDKGLWVIDHECAHIASAIKHKDWRHGERFHWMYAACRKRNQA